MRLLARSLQLFFPRESPSRPPDSKAAPMYFLKFILCPLIVLMLAACGKHPQQANGHDLRACRPHLNGIIDGEKVVGSGRTSLIVGFAGTAVTSGGMVNYLFGPDPGSLPGCAAADNARTR